MNAGHVASAKRRLAAILADPAMRLPDLAAELNSLSGAVQAVPSLMHCTALPVTPCTDGDASCLPDLVAELNARLLYCCQCGVLLEACHNMRWCGHWSTSPCACVAGRLENYLWLTTTTGLGGCMSTQVSYSISTVTLLCSPQRLSFPFCGMQAVSPASAVRVCCKMASSACSPRMAAQCG